MKWLTCEDKWLKYVLMPSAPLKLKSRIQLGKGNAVIFLCAVKVFYYSIIDMGTETPSLCPKNSAKKKRQCGSQDQ